MNTPMGRAGRIAGFMESIPLALYLLLGLVLLAINGTLFSPEQGERFYRLRFGEGFLPVARVAGLIDTFRSPLFLTMVALLSLNIVWCTMRRLSRRRRKPLPAGTSVFHQILPWLDAVLHASLLLLLVGAVLKGSLGTVGTQYLFAGSPVTQVDDPLSERALPLGFTVILTGREDEYYPPRARMGVTDIATGRKLALVELREGKDAIPVPGLRLAIAGEEANGPMLLLKVVTGGAETMLKFPMVGTKKGEDVSRTAGNYRLTLVGYRRELRQVRGVLSILEGEREVKSGRLSANSPIIWRGTRLSLIGWGADDSGARFLGIQAARDPGAIFFWSGAVLFCLLLPLFMLVRWKAHEHGGS